MKKNIFKNKNAIAFTVLFFSTVVTFAQDVAATEAKPETYQIPKMFWDPITYVWILLGSIVLLTIYTMSRTITVLTKVVEGKYDRHTQTSAQAAAQTQEVKTPSAWSKMMNVLVRAVPIEKEKDVMLDHDYDGIDELDNQLPPWWKYGFYFTIIFAFVYIFNFHVSGSGKLQLAEYKEEVAKADAEKKLRMEKDANMVTASNVVALTDPAALASGKEIYVKNCKACHGDFGQGVVGPNLTDEYWIHGGGAKNVFNTITEGVTGKGMISWKSQLAPKKIQEVTSYILTLKGTNPAAAKEPQGTIWVEEVTASVDSTMKSDATGVDSTKAVAQKEK